jgi:hypothetical protein
MVADSMGEAAKKVSKHLEKEKRCAILWISYVEMMI